MTRALVDRIADAVLYEGYILYPYRPSVKNRQRWTFGGLYPEAYRQGQSNDPASNQTECLVSGSPTTIVHATVRFLHLTARIVGEITEPLLDWPAGVEVPFRPVETLRVGDKHYHTWQEAELREVILPEMTLGELSASPKNRPFSFPDGRRSELVPGTSGDVAGILVRQQHAIEGGIEAEAVEVEEGLFRLRVRVVNRTPVEEGCRCRDEAVLRSLVSTHVVLGVQDGEFVSLLDPPACWSEAAAACRNVGLWPVLVGAEGQKDTMLSAPIILYDYPQVAAESPGDFFDGTEIDEMLTLRILTLTTEEKQAMAAVDERAGTLLERTEALAFEQLLGLHGTLRDLGPMPKENALE